MNLKDLFIENKLPDPLAKKELIECFNRYKNGDMKAREEIINHNIKLVMNQVLKKFINSPHDKKELVSIGINGLIKAVDTFDIDKNVEFSTYAIKCINNEILMFIRSGNKYIYDESLDKPIATSKDGKDLKVEDTVADDNAYVDVDIERKEIIFEIRRLVESLEDREKEIIKLYFGFYDDLEYSQEDISEMFGLSRSYISRIISKAVDYIKLELEKKGFIEENIKRGRIPNVKSSIYKTVEKGDKMSKALKSIYEYFSSYTKEQIDSMIEKLNDEDKALLHLRYGNDLSNPCGGKLSNVDSVKFYGSLVPKMKRLLENPNMKQRGNNKNSVDSTVPVKKDVVEDKSVDKTCGNITSSMNTSLMTEDSSKLFELLRSANFDLMLKSLSVKEAVIVSLRLGYVDGKCFSTSEIANFLGINEQEVIDITRKVLLVFKSDFDKFFDKVIVSATSSKGQFVKK